jgi:hypothetical protein
MMKSYSDIVPDDMQNRLIALRDSQSAGSFEIGDIALTIVEMNPEEQKMDVYKAIGMFVGKASRTVREYAAVSGFYSRGIRIRYHALSFDHFRVAMRYGEYWEDALEWAIKKTDDLNRPASVDAMEARADQYLSSENFELEEAPDTEENGLLKKFKSLRSLLIGIQGEKYEALRDLVEEAIDLLESLEE